jgi:hypothetical protein
MLLFLLLLLLLLLLRLFLLLLLLSWRYLCQPRDSFHNRAATALQSLQRQQQCSFTQTPWLGLW